MRAIAEVSTAVTQGDLTRSITVEAQGEVAELKDNINQMIVNLRETTKKNAEQDWLKTNLARIAGMLQGQRDLDAVSQLIMSEVTPLVGAQHGAFFLVEHGDRGRGRAARRRLLRLQPKKGRPDRFALGDGLVGQAAVEGKTIRVADVPPDYIKISSALGDADARAPGRPAGPVRGAGARRHRARRRCGPSARSTWPSWTSSRTPSASSSTRSWPTCAPRSCWPSRRR